MTFLDFLALCSIINKNLEILKFIVYSLIKTSKSLDYISKVSGKSIYAINRCQTIIYRGKNSTLGLFLRASSSVQINFMNFFISYW